MPKRLPGRPGRAAAPLTPERTAGRVTVAAPPVAVMSVVADVAAYPQWNDEVRSAQVLAVTSAGRPARARFVIDAGPVRDTYTVSYEWERDRAVRWTLADSALLDALDGAYLLTDNGEGTTEVVYHLALELKVPVLALLRRKGEQVIVDRALHGLKQRAESR